jgi:hypothetical protein
LAKSPKGINKTSPSEPAGHVPLDVKSNAPKEGESLAQQTCDQGCQPTLGEQSTANCADTVDAGSATLAQLMTKTTSSQDYPTSTYYEHSPEGITQDASINGGAKNWKTLHLGEPFEQCELDEMEQMLRGLCGHLGWFTSTECVQ